MSRKTLKEIYNFNPTVKLYTDKYTHTAKNFDSGKYAFNDYIVNDALKDINNGDGVTYIVTEEKDDEEILIAYYTIIASTIHFIDDYDFHDDEIDKKDKRIHYSPISTIMITMFAVNDSYQDTLYKGQLVSDIILKRIIHDIYNMTTSVIGAKKITLCSVPDAIPFYKRNKFEEISSNLTMFDKAGQELTPMCLTMHDS